MAEKRSRTDKYLFRDDRYTTHEDSDGRRSTAEDVSPIFGRDHTEFRDEQDEVYGRSYENETLLLGDPYTEFEYEDGRTYTAWLEERTFSGDPYVVVRDRHGEKVGEAWLESAVFGGPTVKTEGVVPQGLASEMLGAREARREREEQKEAKREKKTRKKARGGLVPGPDDGFFGLYWHVIKGVTVLLLMLLALVLGAMMLAVALAMTAVAAIAQVVYAEMVRRRLGPAVRLYAQRGPRVAWVGVAVGLTAGLLLIPVAIRGGDGVAWLVALGGIAGGVYLSRRASLWISERRLGSLDPGDTAGVVEPSPVAFYGALGVLAVGYLGLGVWLATAGGESANSPSYVAAPAAAGGEAWDEYTAAEGVHNGGGGAFASESGEVVYVDAPGDGFLAVRSEPSVRTGDRLDAIPHRAAARVLDVRPVAATVDGIRGRWLCVAHGATRGWVFDGYVSDRQPPEIETVPADAWAVVDAPGEGSLNLRAWSSPSSRILGEMPRGTRVYVSACRPEVTSYSSGTPGRWCRVRWGDQEGWAFDAHLAR